VGTPPLRAQAELWADGRQALRCGTLRPFPAREPRHVRLEELRTDVKRTVRCEADGQGGLKVDTGVVIFPTHNAISPADMARLAEERGLESLFFPEHNDDADPGLSAGAGVSAASGSRLRTANGEGDGAAEPPGDFARG
jgi:hypothetical protein